MHKIILAVTLLYATVFHSFAHAGDRMPYITNLVPNAAKVGEGKLEVFIWNFYDAYLYAPYGYWDPSEPHAIRFVYLRSFTSEELASSIVDQMRRFQGVSELQLAAWYNRLLGLLPNVKENDELVAVATKNRETMFYFHSSDATGLTHKGKIMDATFTHHYFAIWLGDKVGYPELRSQLLKSY